MKKRILQYRLSSNPGGIEVVSINIFNNINRNEFIFDYIIAGENIAFEEEINRMGGKVYKITNRKKIFSNII